MLSKVGVIVAHSNYDSGADRQRIPWTDVLDVRTGYGRRGEGSVDSWEESTWDRRFGFSRPVPVLVVHAGAVSILVNRKFPLEIGIRIRLTDRRCRDCRWPWGTKRLESLRSLQSSGLALKPSRRLET